MHLQDQSLHALQQRVVQVASDSLALVETSFHPLHVTAVPPVAAAVDKARTRTNRTPTTHDSAEPGGLVVGRSDGEIQECAGLVPHAAVIASHHAEAVVAGRKIVIEGLPAIAGVLPIAIPAFQLVAKKHLLRRDEAERRVVDLQIADSGGRRNCPFASEVAS